MLLDAVVALLFGDAVDPHALEEHAPAAAKYDAAPGAVGDRGARREVVAVRQVGLPVVADAGHQRELARDRDVVLDESRQFELRGELRRVAARDAIGVRDAADKRVKVRERKRAAEVGQRKRFAAAVATLPCRS